MLDDDQRQRDALVLRAAEQLVGGRLQVAHPTSSTEPVVGDDVGVGSRSIHLWPVTGAGESPSAITSSIGPRPLGQHAVGRAQEGGVRGPVEEREQRLEEAVDVEEHDRLGEQAELVPGQHLERLVQRSVAAGHGHEAVGQLGHPGLALVHRVDDVQLGEPLVGDLGPDEVAGDDPVDLTAGGEHGVGERPPSGRRGRRRRRGRPRGDPSPSRAGSPAPGSAGPSPRWSRSRRRGGEAPRQPGRFLARPVPVGSVGP